MKLINLLSFSSAAVAAFAASIPTLGDDEASKMKSAVCKEGPQPENACTDNQGDATDPAGLIQKAAFMSVFDKVERAFDSAQTPVFGLTPNTLTVPLPQLNADAARDLQNIGYTFEITTSQGQALRLSSKQIARWVDVYKNACPAKGFRGFRCTMQAVDANFALELRKT